MTAQVENSTFLGHKRNERLSLCGPVASVQVTTVLPIVFLAVTAVNAIFATLVEGGGSLSVTVARFLTVLKRKTAFVKMFGVCSRVGE